MARTEYSKHAKTEEKKGCLHGILKFIGTILGIVIILLAGMLIFLSVTEFKPDDRMAAEVAGEGSQTLAPGDTFDILTWNIGYGALGDNADFFMDGGSMVNTADKERVLSNMDGIESALDMFGTEIIFLQETDQDSSRSHHVNELKSLRSFLTGYSSSFANNFKVAYLPYPIPPMGKVDSGVATFSRYDIESSERVQLPIPFSWPIRMANLKRCVLESRIPLEGSDKELVLMNLHLEAYDNGEGKIAQTKMLADLLNEEAAKGNYVIAGGDFNQIFSSADTTRYPAQEGKWQAGEIDVTAIDGDWQFIMDATVPSCRSLDQPYTDADIENFQYYLIDGFIVSGNIDVVSYQTEQMNFAVSDHNPVMMQVKLKEK